ncbi:MAG TPA: PIN domain-containing protein [Alphaproteobacteria bacterium]|nr:PIN domain-containing protein [Alphaproteobacteria bacterium]
MTADRRVFIDTNILVYATLRNAPAHAAAMAALGANGADCYVVSRQILREFLATMSRPGVAPTPQPMVDLVPIVEHYQRRFTILEDGPLVTARLHELLRSHPTAGKQVHDANIVATMLAHGVGRLLTANRADFARFEGLIALLPLA